MFVEFKVVSSEDEMVIGVSHNPDQARLLNGWSNCGTDLIYTYSRKPTMGMIKFGQTKIIGRNYFVEGDLVAIYVNTDNRQVSWYRNGKFVATNLPKYPLPAIRTSTNTKSSESTNNITNTDDDTDDSSDKNNDCAEDSTGYTYGIYAMVDTTLDTVTIVNFGFRKPYPDMEEDVSIWEKTIQKKE